MKVIKPGLNLNSNETKRFECDLCGCVFEAEKGEYKAGFMQPGNELAFFALCPNCGKRSKEVIMR